MVAISIPVAIIGFKKSNKALAALSLLLITGSFGLAEVYHKRKGIAKENTGMAANDAKSIYETNCASCHGTDGKLGLAGAKDLSATLLDNAAIKDVIKNGKGLMPASQLDDEKANIVAEYVGMQIKGH
jgi:mono/diheme cytochrome c family protein